MSDMSGPCTASDFEAVRGAVDRPRVCASVCESSARLYLLQAPAGFGKTTAMLQCQARLNAQGVGTAWLTLDRADNDISRFLSNLETALRKLGCEVQRPGSAHDLMQALAHFDGPLALFLDDFEWVREPVVLGWVQELIDHLPRDSRLVIGSRSEPALALGRLRVRGQVVDIPVEWLRFDEQETAAFLRHRGYGALPAELVHLLHQRTEGWAAALSLASAALHRSKDTAEYIARLSESDRAIGLYLAEDVFEQLDSEVQVFLLRTSILRQLSEPLCQALCPDLDARRLLHQIVRDNLFLLPVTSAQGQWRYHSLFAGFLRHRLAEHSGEQLPHLHLAASAWYEGQRRPVPAIDHALAAQDWDRALDLLEPHAEALLEQGRMRLLARWCDALPAAQLRARPQAQVAGIWATCFTRGPWEAAQQVAACASVRVEQAQVQSHFAAMRPEILAMQDRYQEAYVAGMASLQTVPPTDSFARSVLCNSMANIFCVLGNAREAQRLLDGARQAGAQQTFNRMYAESMEGMLDLLAGRLRHARARFRLAVDATHSANFSQTHGNAWAGVLYAMMAYESDQIDHAEHLINVYLPMIREVGLPDHMILSHTMRARMAFLAGDVDRAWQTLAELEDLGHQRKLARVVVGARLERARVLMLQGHAEPASEELRRADLPDIWEREREQRLLAHDLDYLRLAQLRWSLQFGDAAATLAPLARELESARLSGRLRRALRVQLLRGIAALGAGRQDLALADATQVLRTASEQGFVRLILDEGAQASALFHLLQRSGSVGNDPLAREHLDRLLSVLEPAPAAASDLAPVAPTEALTSKELGVLELLALGYSNSAMAEKLGISDSTVRTHLRNINLKLNASSRTHAVAVARRIGLVR